MASKVMMSSAVCDKPLIHTGHAGTAPKVKSSSPRTINTDPPTVAEQGDILLLFHWK
jgi:hypothetical protein